MLIRLLALKKWPNSKSFIPVIPSPSTCYLFWHDNKLTYSRQRKDRENLEPRKPAQPSKNYKHKRDPLPASYYTKMHKHKIPVPKTYFPSWAQKEKSDDISLDREIVNNEPLGQVKTEVSSTSEHQNIEGAEEAKQKAFLNCDTDIIIFEEYIKMGLGTRRIKERN